MTRLQFVQAKRVFKAIVQTTLDSFVVIPHTQFGAQRNWRGKLQIKILFMYTFIDFISYCCFFCRSELRRSRIRRALARRSQGPRW